jgi:hypothetical protein
LISGTTLPYAFPPQQMEGRTVMSKFNTATVKPNVTSPVKTSKQATGATYNGAPGFARDAKGELFLLAVSNMVGENTFYERAGARDQRFEDLVRQVAIEDPDWLSRMIPWLRAEANMRSASLVMAAEMVKARIDAKAEDSTPNLGTEFEVRGFNRRAIDAACQRPDEPAELLAYWISKHGKALPKPVKRGLADAAARLYSERSLLKYDSKGDAVRMADVIELTHPSPDVDKRIWQGDLFRHAIDRRHNRESDLSPRLKVVAARKELTSLDQAGKDALLASEDGAEKLREAGMTWEATAGWKQGKMDANAWEKQIPSMGYMATIRNLRNFDDAKISEEACNQVALKIANADEVRKSRQFPFRFLAAYKNAGLRWAWPLEQALNMSLENVPELKGRTLILVDRSGSMFYSTSEKTEMTFADSAALFGSALALRAEKATLVQYGTSWQEVKFTKGDSILRMIDRFGPMGGTDTQGAVSANYKAHDRVIVLTDEQANYHGSYDVFAAVPKTVPCYTWNLAGYRMGHAPSGAENRHTFGGLSDQAFRLIPLLEAGRNGDWPF